VKGKSPAMRAFLIARAKRLWCLAQVPVYLGGFILFKGSKNLDKVSMS